MNMNKKGVTILELLISISLIGVVILMLLKVMFSLDSINNDQSYASNDEIDRTSIIKEIEQDFLENKLRGIDIKKEKDNTLITFKYDNKEEILSIYIDRLEYKSVSYKLESSNATYDLDINYTYDDLNPYYLITLNIPVLIKGENTTLNDDITLTYLNLKNAQDSY